MIRPPPNSTLFPSPPLFRSSLQPLGDPLRHPPHLGLQLLDIGDVAVEGLLGRDRDRLGGRLERTRVDSARPIPQQEADLAREQDRKSTRLNSSHSQISYAVF